MATKRQRTNAQPTDALAEVSRVIKVVKADRDLMKGDGSEFWQGFVSGLQRAAGEIKRAKRGVRRVT